MSSEPVTAPKVLKRGAATGERPNCALCLKNSQKCVYDVPQKPRTHVKKLEDKIQVSRPGRQAKRDEQEAFSQAFEELWGTSSTFGVDTSNLIDRKAPSAEWTATESVVQADYFPVDVLNQLIEETENTNLALDPWAFETIPIAQSTTTESIFPSESRSIVPELFASMQINPNHRLSADSSQPLSTPSLSSMQGSLLHSPSSAPLEDRVTALRAHVLIYEELPEHIQTPLLDLFFSRMAVFQFDMNIDRFRSSLQESDPKDQPHPAFLFAMYYCASLFSSDEAVRALDDLFFEIAQKKLDNAVNSVDHRMIDLIRTAIVLSSSSYSRARFRPAWVFGGLAMRLCSIVNLQRITFPFSSMSNQHPKPSSRCFDRKSYKGRSRRFRSPKDFVELGEFIQLFWIAWTMDRVGSTSNGSPPAMHWTEIETPFPLPLYRYADINLVNNQPNTALYDLFDDSQTTLVGDLFVPFFDVSILSGPLHLTDSTAYDTLRSASCFYIATFFLNEASRLEDEFIQPSVRDGYLAYCVSHPLGSATPSANSVASFNMTTGVSDDVPGNDLDADEPKPVPTEIVRLQNALIKFVKSLPAHQSNPAQIVLGGLPSWGLNQVSPVCSTSDNPSEQSGQTWGIDPETVLIHTGIHTAFALIYQERSDFEPSAWAQAVSSARSVVKILHMVAHVDFSRLSLVMVISWRIVAHVLLNEVKRQRSEGNEEEALQITIDVELVILALKRFGEIYAVGTTSADYLK
ncbi:Zn(2)-C6 fungal-type DNA-binding domain [Phaffia rhodozyma]|uniref:Zn(2)-C6 fungal-type DNA-binding domain n=1 Tax=Phaffia rhodozyma TaxID=264483 RepID=A0A0F7SQR9_PHARH|nr:Zn(2)-C6 fungal-type DNA-binding domain [Phaffia rhodozyma]